jgi:hypothetical protein
MEPETRDKRLLRRVEWMISAAAFAGGIAAAIYFRDWIALGLIGCGVFVGLPGRGSAGGSSSARSSIF